MCKKKWGTKKSSEQAPLTSKTMQMEEKKEHKKGKGKQTVWLIENNVHLLVCNATFVVKHCDDKATKKTPGGGSLKY